MARTLLARAALVADARNRALRTVVQSSAAAGVVIVITAAVSVAGGSAFNWRALAGALAVAVLMPIASAVQRLYVDPAGVGGLNPPTDPTETTRRRRRTNRKAAP